MLITGGINSILQLPQPALGLVGAIHSTSVTSITLVGGTYTLPDVTTVSGHVFKNNTGTFIDIPAQGNYPARSIPNGEYFASNGTAYYWVKNKKGITRQVLTVIGGVFTTVGNCNFINGESVTLYGFQGSALSIGGANFSDTGTQYHIANVTSNTFQIADSEGNIYTNASTNGNTGGWAFTQATDSYYPNDFERTIYTFPFTLQSLPTGATWSINRKFSFRSISATTNAVWSIIMEFGSRYDDQGPGIVGPNIAGFNYAPPALEQQVLITDVPNSNNLGLTIKRNPDGTISVSRYIYSQIVNGIPGTYPTTNDFILRVRVGQFDTENSITDTSGYVAYSVEPGAIADNIGK